MFRKRISQINVLRVVLTLVAWAFAAPCNAAEAPFSASQRQAEIERLKDGLNSPNSTTRIVTLEHAIASKDPTLRRIALSTAFASADSDLRSTALVAAISSAATFLVDITVASGSHEVSKGLGTSFEVRIFKFDRSTNTFRTTSAVSSDRQTGSAGHSGAVSGDRISFEFDLGYLGTTSGTCSGVARLQGGSAVLNGTMSCRFFGNNENYDIAANVLR